MKLLLIEDNKQLAEWLARILRNEQFTVDCAEDGASADRILLTETYDAVLLDLLLPRLTGKQVLRRLRERHSNVPVMIITASDSVDEKVVCLGAGADDYLVKPFEVRELVARIKALIRRQAPDRSPELGCGDLVYDTDTRRFFIAGQPLTLPAREHAVLEILMLRQGKTVSKAALANGVFGLQDDAGPDTIEIYVSRLRKKLDASSAGIMTLRGLGYLLKEKADA
jgi:DNA-binding response OmpR family regulator